MEAYTFAGLPSGISIEIPSIPLLTVLGRLCSEAEGKLIQYFKGIVCCCVISYRRQSKVDKLLSYISSILQRNIGLVFTDKQYTTGG